MAHMAGDSRFDRWPMDWGPVVSCGWGEAMTYHTYAGTITPEQLRADAFVATIAGLTGGQLWFGLVENTEPSLVAAMMRVSRELQEMRPALAAPIEEEVMTPIVTVAGASTLSGAAIVPQPIVARAWSEPAAVDAEEPFCVWVMAVNTSPEPVIADLLLSDESSLMAMVPRNASLINPFNPVFTDPAGLKTVREIPLPLGSANVSSVASGRMFRDVILAGGATVYQLGCQVVQPTSSNLVLNPSFEEFVVAGTPSVSSDPTQLHSFCRILVIHCTSCAELGSCTWQRWPGSQSVNVARAESAIARKALPARRRSN